MGLRGPSMKPERELQITHYAATGRSMTEIGRDLGITRQRVHQLFAKVGVLMLWERVNIDARDVLPEPGPPPVIVCCYCGRDIDGEGARGTKRSHAACWQAAHTYRIRMANRERYRTDPAYRQYQADYQRAHPKEGREAALRWRINNPEQYQASKKRRDKQRAQA